MPAHKLLGTLKALKIVNMVNMILRKRRFLELIGAPLRAGCQDYVNLNKLLQITNRRGLQVVTRVMLMLARSKIINNSSKQARAAEATLNLLIRARIPLGLHKFATVYIKVILCSVIQSLVCKSDRPRWRLFGIFKHSGPPVARLRQP